ncbi:MAG TPA: tetratricopeptide repeat protein [Bryobacteraceae bacterium]|jgi:tetratricopeptide (TPR) repeat protein|nr:tetratricopeptide repeat protein [Bryobacteraceae bacterium]
MWILLLALLAQAVDFQADGMKALEAQKYEEAAALFAKAVAADPKDYSAHFHLALSYSLLEKDAQAIAEYKTVLELQPGLYEAQVNLGFLLVRTLDPATAIPHLKAAVAKKPQQFRPVFYLGEALLETGAMAEAEAAYRTAVGLKADSVPAQVGLARSLARQGRFNDAEPVMLKAIALDPARKDLRLELAAQYESNQQAEKAIAIYRDFAADPGAQERLGLLLLQSGRPEDAAVALEAAVAKSPTPANRIALAHAYSRSKQLEKAASLAAQALASAPKDFELRLFYARLLRDQRKFVDAAQQFFAATQIKPDSVEAWNELAAVLIVDAQYPQGIAALERLRSLGAETSGHLYLRAMSLDHLHQNKEALLYYEKFLAASQGKSPDEEFKARQRARILQKETGKR